MIMTANGWRHLEPRNCIAPTHTRSLLEAEGLTPDPEGKVAKQYCEAIRRFIDYPQGHPLSITEQEMLGVMGSKNLIPGWSRI